MCEVPGMSSYQKCVTAFGVFDLSTHTGMLCPNETMELTLGNEKYDFKRETASALTILKANPGLWPAIVCFPSRLTPAIIFLHATFPKFEGGKIWAKGEARRDYFLNPALMSVVRDYGVKSVIVGKTDLLREIAALDEPRLDDSLYEVYDLSGSVRSVKAAEVLNRPEPRVGSPGKNSNGHATAAANEARAGGWLSMVRKKLGI